jgi:hypothetical protein
VDFFAVHFYDALIAFAARAMNGDVGHGVVVNRKLGAALSALLCASLLTHADPSEPFKAGKHPDAKCSVQTVARFG